MAMPATTFPEKVEREILLRLEPTLFRCAAACKRWRRLVAAPSFLLQRRWPRSLFVGYFTQRCRVAMFPGTSPTAGCNSQLAFVLLPGPSLLGCTDRRPLSSFIVHADDDAAGADVVDRSLPLATRGSLLLVRLYPSNDDPEHNVVRLAVCNPLDGTWEVLPELDCDSRFSSSEGYGRDIIPRIAGNDGPAYRVLLIGADKHKSQYNLHTFAASEASWSAPVMCFNMMEHQMWSMAQSRAVVCGRQAHWLFLSRSNHFHVLNVDVETGRVSLTRLLRPT